MNQYAVSTGKRWRIIPVRRGLPSVESYEMICGWDLEGAIGCSTTVLEEPMP